MSTEPNKPATDADLIAKLTRENEMLKAENKVRTDQVAQAVKIATQANDMQKARDEAERQTLIGKIVVDTNSRYTKEQLSGKNLNELQLMYSVVQTSMDQTFASIAVYQAEQDKANSQPLFTAGFYDRATKTFKGGI
jgi:LPS O-antigen subunit length determinant protein (WzzB/FepE family)